jgi:hypothetical protein
MGNSCCNKENADYNNIDEFYDPFNQMKNRVCLSQAVILKHSPNKGTIIDTLPRKIIKI